MYHFALARSTRREKKNLPLDCDKCSFFRLYHIKCEESNRVFEISYCQAKKRYYTFNPFFFAVLWIYQKCHYDLRLQESSPHLLRNGGCFSLMTNMQIIGSIVCSLSPVSEKKSLHSPSHLCASKRSHVCLYMLNMMIKMACTNAHFRAESRKRDPFFV